MLFIYSFVHLFISKQLLKYTMELGEALWEHTGSLGFFPNDAYSICNGDQIHTNYNSRQGVISVLNEVQG